MVGNKWKYLVYALLTLSTSAVVVMYGLIMRDSGYRYGYNLGKMAGCLQEAYDVQ